MTDPRPFTTADLYGGYAVAAEPTAGLEAVEVPATAEVGTFTGVQNLLYAIEWWVFGGFAAVVWWRFTRDAVLAERAAAEEESSGSDPGEGDGEDVDATPVGSTS